MKPSINKIAVITVNYNNPVATTSCIKSFSKIKTNDEIVYYVVNNGCTDNSNTFISEKLKNIQILNSSVNLGFAGGNNLAINEALNAGCSHILLINNDAEIDSANFFEAMLASPYDLSSATLITQIKEDGMVDYGGLVDWYFGRNIHRYSSGQIDYISGACFFAKSEVFKNVGLLDDNFFLYYEDVDYCLRATKLGYTIGVIPEIKVTHTLSDSTNKLGAKKVQILAQSHFLFCQKYLPISSIPFYYIFNFYLRFKSLFL